MVSEELQKLYRRALQMMISHVAMTGLIVFFLGFILPPNPQSVGVHGSPDVLRILDVIRYVFLALALLAFAVGPLIRKRILSRGPVTPPAQSNLSPVTHGVWMLFIIGMAASGMPAIMGAVLFTMTRNYADLMIFSGLSAVLMALGFPRPSQWEEWERTLAERVRH